MKTLIIMAAGMGSRYGGQKQTDGFGPCGEFIMDYSLFDARREGFDRAVFVIRKDDLELFESTVGKRVGKSMQIDYVFQDMNDIPEGTVIPESRVKPWGTAHAVYCARKKVTGPFAVINADDFYGRGAFKSLCGFLSKAEAAQYCMIGYELTKTLTENGGVSRGVCRVDKSGYLMGIEEDKSILIRDNSIVSLFEDGTSRTLEPGTIVSMNCWGFMPDLFDKIGTGLTNFFKRNSSDLTKCEYYLLEPVEEEIEKGTSKISVIPTEEQWFGVTYREDREKVKMELAALIEKGVYPENLWGNA